MDMDAIDVVEEEYTEQKGSEESGKTSLVPFDPLQKYLAEVRRYPLLTPEEEKRLAIQYRETGDIDAAYRLITGNLRLVVQIALEFHRSWMMNLLDLVQEGNIGLMKAVRKYDPYKGTKLSYYASFWIKAYILKFIIDNWRLVKVGTTQSQRKLFFNLEKEKRRLEALGYYPTPKLLAETLHTKEKDVIEMDQRLGGWEVSIDRRVGDESDSTFKDILPADDIPHDDALIESETRDIILEKLDEFHETLKDKELYIFEKRLLSDSPMTLQEIGDVYGISKERVRQIEKRLKGKVKHFLQQGIPGIDSDDDFTIDIHMGE